MVAPALPSLDRQLSENLLFQGVWQALDGPTRDLMIRATVLRRPAERELIEALHAIPGQAKAGLNRLRNLLLLTEVEERHAEVPVRLLEIHPSLARLARGLLSPEDDARLREEGIAAPATSWRERRVPPATGTTTSKQSTTSIRSAKLIPPFLSSVASSTGCRARDRFWTAWLDLSC